MSVCPTKTKCFFSCALRKNVNYAGLWQRSLTPVYLPAGLMVPSFSLCLVIMTEAISQRVISQRAISQRAFF